MTPVAVLFARADSIYKAMPGCDVFDAERDARTWPGGAPIVAHPPCRSWGRMAHLAKPADGERSLAPWAVEQVRRCGGVLEHPAASKLWREAGLPAPGSRDRWGGWTLPIVQRWWGHKCDKDTWLYVVGCEPRNVPPLPLDLGEATHVVTSSARYDGRRRRKGDPGWRPHVTPAEREHTPPALAAWLVELARRCRAPDT